MKVRLTIMTTKTTILLTTAAAAMLALGAGAGCNNSKQEAAQNAIFKPEGQERVSAFADVQAANGARNDAMLYAHHFDGGQLNSLGRAKVLLMLDDPTTASAGDRTDPRTVHLVDAGEGELLAQRKQSVELYLKTAQGPNTLAFHPAAPNLVRFAKTESGTLEQTTPSAGQSGMTPAPAPMSSPTTVK
jgi:hypothetical protein